MTSSSFSCSNEISSRRETELIEEVVEEIITILELHKRSNIPKLIGMESSVRTITSFLNDDSSNAPAILTIWGMAGIGKTYLAKYIFKLHYFDFERNCFLEDIERKCTPPNGLLDLQKQLLKDIGDGSSIDAHDADVCTFKIEKSLLRKRTLLVLDGIDKSEQLDVLIGTKGLHSGSKIIITSKNGSLTEKCRLFKTEVPPKHMKHLLQGLDDIESLRLLRWHAFGHSGPKEGDEKESMKVMEYCKGHPLALKVLGSSVHNEDATWEDILESLGKETDPDIQKVLQISFDSLPHEKDKELFKHIACFFIGEDREFTEKMLKACGICRSSGINNLVNRCLLTIGPFDKLAMHQLIQDMGRDIVRQESPKKPWKRSLLWHHEESLKVLQEKKGTKKNQGLILDMKTIEKETSHGSSSVNVRNFEDDLYNIFKSFLLLRWVRALLSVIWWLCDWVLGLCSPVHHQKGGLETLAFSEMCNLRILRLNYVQLDGSYKKFPNCLRLLCMHGFSLRYIPSDLQMENMVALDLSNSKLQQLWKKPKFLGSLKFLNLSCCHELVSVGHFSGLPLLERLTLAGCTSLVEVCESIGKYCDRLEVLDLSYCNKLKKLPRSIAKLKKLRKLSIDGCSDLVEIPCEMNNMESLQELEANNINIKSHVSSSAIVEGIPRSFKSFMISLPSSLVKLSLRNNNLSNESFPMDFSSLSMLEELYLDNNPIDSLPDCVRSLSRLCKLSLENCRRLKTVVCAPSTITCLEVSECRSLEKITFQYPESALQVFDYQHTFSLSEIQGMFKLQSISEIDEEILHSLGWINIEYVKSHKLSFVDSLPFYQHEGNILPAQMLYEHGIFSTYLEGQEVPKCFTQRRRNSSSFTLPSSPKNCRIRGINVCIVMSCTSSSIERYGPSRIAIRNLTKKCSWMYEPITYVLPKGIEEVRVVWLSHWMFGNNEFEDGDEVGVYVCSIVDRGDDVKSGYGGDYEHAWECGMSLVYKSNDGNNKKEDPLADYKSWKHIIGKDLHFAILDSGDYFLQPKWYMKSLVYPTMTDGQNGASLWSLFCC